jgi:hypothetical protein
MRGSLGTGPGISSTDRGSEESAMEFSVECRSKVRNNRDTTLL